MNVGSGGVFIVARASKVKRVSADDIEAVRGKAGVSGASIGGRDNAVGIEEGGEFGRSGAINHTIW